MSKILGMRTDEELMQGASEQTKKLANYEKLENTPFTLAELDTEEGIKWYVLMGKYRLSEAMETKEKAEEDAERQDWERLLQIIQIMIEANIKGQ